MSTEPVGPKLLLFLRFIMLLYYEPPVITFGIPLLAELICAYAACILKLFDGLEVAFSRLLPPANTDWSFPPLCC